MNKNKNLNKTLLIKSFHVTPSPESKTQAFIKFWYFKKLLLPKKLHYNSRTKEFLFIWKLSN